MITALIAGVIGALCALFFIALIKFFIFLVKVLWVMMLALWLVIITAAWWFFHTISRMRVYIHRRRCTRQACQVCHGYRNQQSPDSV